MGPLSRPVPAVAYGIDDSGGRLIVVRAARRRAAAAFAVVHDGPPTADGTRAEAALPGMVAEVAGGGAVTAAGLSAPAGLVRWLATPFSSPGKAVRVLPSLLDLQLPFPVEQCRYRVAAVRRDADGRVQILAAAARVADLEDRLAQLQSLGFDPPVIEPEGLVIWHESRRVADPPRVVVWLGADRSTLVIGDARGFLSAHGLRAGAPALAGEAARRQWASRVRHVVRSQAGADGERFGWLWTGPGAETAELCRRLESELAIAAEYAIAPAPAAFLATALARRALEAPIPDANLRTGAQAHPELARREQRAVVGASVAVLLAGAVLAALGIGGRAAFAARDRLVQGEVTQLAMDLTGLPASAIARGNEVFIARQYLAEDRDAGDPFSRALGPGPSRILHHGIEIAHRLNLQISSVAARDQTFTIRGVAPDGSAAEDYARALRDQGMAAELTPVPAGGDAPVAFVVKGGWPDG